MNWFQKDESGTFIWPGFGDNIRVVKWMVDRIEGKVAGTETALGFTPRPTDIDTEGLELDPTQLERILSVDPGKVEKDLEDVASYLDTLGEKLPQTLVDQLQLAKSSLRP